MRSRSLHTKDVTDEQVELAIEGLLRGDKVDDLPTYLCKSVISTMTQQRKDAILRREDSLASKMDDILGELQRGPHKYLCDTAREPAVMREITYKAPTKDTQRITNTAKQLGRGAQLEAFEISDRQMATPELKTKRARVVSRSDFPKSRDVDRAVDRCVEYELDSRRVGPRLLKVEDLREQLDNARAAYRECRERCRDIRLREEAIRSDQHDKLEEWLKDELFDYGSHVPRSLPLEFSKFSTKVLDTRRREQKSAHFRRYDDAAALRREAVKKEKEELHVLTERFGRSYKLQKQEVVRKQDQKRSGFKDHWQWKGERTERQLAAKLSELKRAVEHLERDLAEAQGNTDAELRRIKNNDRLVNTPVIGRPASTQRRF
jgi:hypothetical protein